jgi:hypothetical protein
VEGIIKSTQRAPPTRELFQLLKYRKKYILWALKIEILYTFLNLLSLLTATDQICFEFMFTKPVLNIK